LYSAISNDYVQAFKQIYIIFFLLQGDQFGIGLIKDESQEEILSFSTPTHSDYCLI
jgi:hypothetical protein